MNCFRESLLVIALLLGGLFAAQTSFAQPIVTEILDATGDGAGNTLTHPFGIVVDASGNVFVAGTSTYNVFKITPGGTVTEILDINGDGSSLYGGSDEIALDSAGNLIAPSDTTDNVFKVTPTGTITEIASGTPLGPGVAVDSADNIFVSTGYGNSVLKVAPGGGITTIIDSTGDGAGNTLSFAHGVAVDTNDNVYVTGSGSDNAFKITPGGVITEIIDSTGDGVGNTLDDPEGIAIDHKGNVYVPGHASWNAFKITPGGAIGLMIDSSGDGQGNPFVQPRKVAVDSKRNVYIPGGGSDNLFKIEPGGTITQIVDASGDGAGNPLDFPLGITVDASGDVYLTCNDSTNAFRVTPDSGGGGFVDWVTIGAPGNPPDDTGWGSVPSAYRIGRTEVTNTQYVAFLNAMAESDPNELWDIEMTNDIDSGGITRGGSDGSYTYAVKPGFEDKPVVWVSWFDAARFVNWLHNGQPMGAQGLGTTEDGAYTLNASLEPLCDEWDCTELNEIMRNLGALYAIPSESEWYKAAYYDPLAKTYFDYPMASDTSADCVMPASDTGNAANCYAVFVSPGEVTDVGAYALSESPSATVDQAGNAWEWTERVGGQWRKRRGGSASWGPAETAATAVSGDFPNREWWYYGFRIVESLTGDVVVTSTGGGTIETADGGVTLEFDPGDLSSDTAITVEDATPLDPQVDLLVGGSPATGTAAAAYEFGPDETVFASAVDLTLVFDVTDLSAFERGNLDVYEKIDTNADMVPDTFVPLGASCSVTENPPGIFTATCTVAISGFSILAGIGISPGPPVVPALGPSGMVMLTALLLSSGWARMKPRRGA